MIYKQTIKGLLIIKLFILLIYKENIKINFYEDYFEIFL